MWRKWLVPMAWLAIILVNQLHYPYPDEFEGMLGGLMIWKGHLPYTGFFTHNTPFEYFLASVIVLFGGVSYVRFRLLYGVVIWLWLVFIVRLVGRRWGEQAKRCMRVMVWAIVIGATYWWGQMYVGDVLAAYLLLPVIVWLAWGGWEDVWWISGLTSLAVMTKLSVVYFAAVVYLWIVIGVERKKLVKTGLRLVVPYLVWAIYFVVTWSWREFWFQAIYFVSKYYAYLPDNVSTKNPFRIAVVLG